MNRLFSERYFFTILGIRLNIVMYLLPVKTEVNIRYTHEKVSSGNNEFITILAGVFALKTLE